MLFLLVEIPTKLYIKTWLENRYGYTHRKHGRVVRMQRETDIGKYFYELVGEPQRHQDSLFSPNKHIVIVEVSYELYLRCGTFLSLTNITRFNTYVEDLIKREMRTFCTALTKDVGSRRGLKITKAIEVYLDEYGFSESTFPTSTIKKDLQRNTNIRKRPQLIENQ